LPFRLWSQPKLSRDLALRILSHVTTRDVARATATGKEFVKAVGFTQQGPLIRLKELRQTHVELKQRDERDWGNPGFQNSVQLWRRRVEHLRITSHSAVLNVSGLLDLATVPDEPFFPSLVSLYVGHFGLLETATWQRLLANCPKLVSIELDRVFAPLDLDWTHTPRHWTTFVIGGASAPPAAIFTAIANPSTVRLGIEPFYNRHPHLWTLADVQNLADKWKGQTDKVTELHLGPIRTDNKENDALVLLLMKHFPNTRTKPWTKILNVNGDTLRALYRIWRCIDQLPPLGLDVWDVTTSSTVIESTHDAMHRIRALATADFWRSWTLDQVQRLIPMSPTWTDIEIEGFKGEFDVKTLDWISTHARNLRLLEIKQPCKVTVAILKQLRRLGAPLTHIWLGDGEASNLADASDVNLDTILALVDYVSKSARTRGGAVIRLCYGALTMLSDMDVQALGKYWHHHVERDVDIEILLCRKTAVPQLQSGSRQEALPGDAGVYRITFTADDHETDMDALYP